MPKLVLSAALFLSVGLVASALAETDAERAAREARLKVDIEACNKGAAVPLDPDARAPAVQFSSLYGEKFDLDALARLSVSCKMAASGATAEKRLKLQWLRTVAAK